MSIIVNTLKGKVEGQAGDGVSIFRGIPFARPPVGALRFRAPQPAEAWSGVLQATRVPPAAPQNERVMQDIPPWDEDCLYLNVFTPSADHGKRPVMVWVHGGGYTMGSGGQQMYEADRLARRGQLLVVTFNYRLGVLGYLYLKEILGGAREVEVNLGLRDQIAALEWVRDNIAAFGGDPQNVTVFGESAGGMSVGSLLAAPGARGLFRRAIAQSGAAHHFTTPEDATRIAGVFLGALGLDPARADRLWELPVKQLLAAQKVCVRERIMRGPPGRQTVQDDLTLIPVADGEALPEQPLGALASGAARQVPLLVGTTLDEWHFFIFLLDPRKQMLDDAALLKVVNRRLPGRGAEAVACYRRALAAKPGYQPWEVFSAFETDRMFRIPAIRLAEIQSAQQPKTFMYLFDWRSPLADGRMGSCHAIDLPFVFGTVDGEMGKLFTGGGGHAHAFSQTVMDSWIAFARNGDPGHAGLGAWPGYDLGRRATMVLGQPCHLVEAPADEQRAFWDELM